MINLQSKKWNIGDKVKIIDNKTKRVIVDNFIINEKNCRLDIYGNIVPSNLISFDNKYYFFEKSDTYTIEKSDNSSIIQLNIPNNYNAELWSNSDKIQNVDVYRECNINELDNEVKNLVHALNQIPHLHTTGSCSGHNKKYLFIDIIFNTFDSILILTNLISKYFNDDFVLTTAKQLVCNNKKTILLQLRSVDIGQKAYIAANRLAELIELELENNG